MAGTTVDPVDSLVELGGKTWRFVDTAGIRRRVHQSRGADFYASLRTRTALEKAEVAVVLIDVSEPLTEQDIRVIQQVIDAGRALIIACNKWDLLDEERRFYLERETADFDLIRSPALAGEVSRGFLLLKPLYQYISGLSPEEAMTDPTKYGRAPDA